MQHYSLDALDLLKHLEDAFRGINEQTLERFAKATTL
jgi:hypothetical protein